MALENTALFGFLTAKAVTAKHLCCVFLGTVKEGYLTQPDTNTTDIAVNNPELPSVCERNTSKSSTVTPIQLLLINI